MKFTDIPPHDMPHLLICKTCAVERCLKCYPVPRFEAQHYFWCEIFGKISKNKNLLWKTYKTHCLKCKINRKKVWAPVSVEKLKTFFNEVDEYGN
jgi:hypothetical protein